MKRKAFLDLLEWKNAKERKPLIIRGARQVGKTYLIKDFGKTCYKDFVYFNFDEDLDLQKLFKNVSPITLATT